MARRLRKPSKGLLKRLQSAKHQDWRKKRAKMQDGRCFYCQCVMRDATLDHVIPLSCGGRDHWENVVAACSRCNRIKGAAPPSPANRGPMNG